MAQVVLLSGMSTPQQDLFWSVIHDAETSGAELDAAYTKVKERMRACSLDELISFELGQWQLMSMSYTVTLWDAAYIIGGGCSDDSFEDFRGGLMLLAGRDVFEAALVDPDSLASVPHVEHCRFEEILSVAWEHYKSRTGVEMPLQGPGRPKLSYPEGHEEPGYFTRIYPKLCKGFGRQSC